MNNELTARLRFSQKPGIQRSYTCQMELRNFPSSFREGIQRPLPQGSSCAWMLGAFEVSHKRSHRGTVSLLVCAKNSICFLTACAGAGTVCHTSLSRTNFLAEQPRDEDQAREQAALQRRDRQLSSQPWPSSPCSLHRLWGASSPCVVRFVRPCRPAGLGGWQLPWALLLSQFTGLWAGNNLVSLQQLCSTTDTLQRRLREKENTCERKPL